MFRPRRVHPYRSWAVSNDIALRDAVTLFYDGALVNAGILVRPSKLEHVVDVRLSRDIVAVHLHHNPCRVYTLDNAVVASNGSYASPGQQLARFPYPREVRTSRVGAQPDAACSTPSMRG